MIPAGIAVDSVLSQLKPVLQKDDIIIEGGNFESITGIMRSSGERKWMVETALEKIFLLL